MVTKRVDLITSQLFLFINFNVLKSQTAVLFFIKSNYIDSR